MNILGQITRGGTPLNVPHTNVRRDAAGACVLGALTLAGALLFAPDAIGSIGAPGANRPASVYVADAVVIGVDPTGAERLRLTGDVKVVGTITATTLVGALAPASLSGYGAAGGYLRSDGSAWVRVSGVAWADITSGVPTTIGGYGITDFNSLGDARWSPLAGSSSIVTVGALASGSIVAGFGGAVFGGDVTLGAYQLSIGTGGAVAGTTGTVLLKNASGGVDFAGGPVCITRGPAAAPTQSFRYTGQTGTLAAPAAPTVGGDVFVVAAAAWDATDAAYAVGARIVGTVIENWTHTARGVRWRLQTADIGGTTVNDRLTLDSAAATFAVPVTAGANSITGATLVGTTRVTSPLFGTTTGVNVVFDRNSVTQLTLGSLLATFAGAVTATTNITLAGDLTNATSGATASQIFLSRAAGQFANIWFQTSGVNRARLSLDNTAETGADVGSNVVLVVRHDDGTSIGTALSITRATMAAKFGASLVVTTGFGCNGAAAQTAYASGGALAAYGTGVFGFDSGANASALYAMVVSIRAALIANGIMS